MLTVEDDAFWQGVEPVVFGGLPQLQVRDVCVGTVTQCVCGGGEFGMECSLGWVGRMTGNPVPCPTAVAT
jgi:hypothetical protein